MYDYAFVLLALSGHASRTWTRHGRQVLERYERGATSIRDLGRDPGTHVHACNGSRCVAGTPSRIAAIAPLEGRRSPRLMRSSRTVRQTQCCHALDRAQHLLALFAHAGDGEQRDGGPFAVESDARRRAVQFYSASERALRASLSPGARPSLLYPHRLDPKKARPLNYKGNRGPSHPCGVEENAVRAARFPALVSQMQQTGIG
jgi:hypothetical protein